MNEAAQASPTPVFVIWAPSWDENSGGKIALHTLCARLNQLGYRACLWPNSRPLLTLNSFRRTKPLSIFKLITRFVRDYASYLVRGRPSFSFGPFTNVLATRRDLRNSIVIYPEIVSGNPLGAERVVRWCLHRPGHHSGKVNYSASDRFFFYLPEFYDSSLSKEDGNLLKVTYVNEAYKRTNFDPRTGSCFLVRKGLRRSLDRHPADAIQVDDMSHEDRAAVFNSAQYLYSYDRYTFYTIFAVMCGCVPIYLPADDEVEPDISERSNGLAYGVDDVPRAKRTAPALLDWVASFQAEETELIERFVRKCTSEPWPAAN